MRLDPFDKEIMVKRHLIQNPTNLPDQELVATPIDGIVRKEP